MLSDGGNCRLGAFCCYKRTEINRKKDNKSGTEQEWDTGQTTLTDTDHEKMVIDNR